MIRLMNRSIDLLERLADESENVFRMPLVGPLGIEGTRVEGALSGDGLMVACAAGSRRPPM